MTYLAINQLASDFTFSGRVRSCVTVESQPLLQSDNPAVVKLASAVLVGAPDQLLTFTRWVASAPGLADKADNGSGGVDQSKVADADILASVQPAFPIIATLFSGEPQPPPNAPQPGTVTSVDPNPLPARDTPGTFRLTVRGSGFDTVDPWGYGNQLTIQTNGAEWALGVRPTIVSPTEAYADMTAANLYGTEAAIRMRLADQFGPSVTVPITPSTTGTDDPPPTEPPQREEAP